MTWAHPDLFALLLLVPVTLVVVVLAERARRRLLGRLAAFEALAGLVAPGVTRARVVQAVLAVVFILLAAIAAAGPRLGFEWQQQKVEGVAIAVVLDVSRSMDAADASPSRMEVARRELQDLVGLLRGDMIALVIFAAGPYVRIPLTEDYSTFLWAVGDSSADTIRAQGTAAAGAIDAALGVLAKAEGSGKAILFISDGELHDEPADVDAALARATEAGVHIYVLGVGDPAGAPIPLEEGGFKKDEKGDVVLSRLDEATLQHLAAVTGGAYVRAVASDADVRALYEDEIRGKLESAERGLRRERLWHERFQWPLAGALAALVFSAGLGIGVGRRVAPLLVIFALTALPRPAWAGAAEDGYRALAGQQWEEAARLLGQARVEDPADPVVTRGLAEALYRTGRYREAEQLFETLADQDPEHKATHVFNAGNAAYRQGRLVDALQDFKEAVAADPKMAAAQRNASAVERELAARRKQEPPPDQSQGGQGQDSPQSGEPQQGEQSGEQGQPGQQPQGSDGAQQQPGGEPQTGEGPDDGGKREGEPQGSDGAKPGQEGTDPKAGQASGQPGEQDPTAEGQPAGGVQGEPGTPGEDAEGAVLDGEGQEGAMTPEEAARLVDGVPDGTPRVVVGGRNTEKDW